MMIMMMNRLSEWMDGWNTRGIGVGRRKKAERRGGFILKSSPLCVCIVSPSYGLRVSSGRALCMNCSEMDRTYHASPGPSGLRYMNRNARGHQYCPYTSELPAVSFYLFRLHQAVGAHFLPTSAILAQLSFAHDKMYTGLGYFTTTSITAGLTLAVALSSFINGYSVIAAIC